MLVLTKGSTSPSITATIATSGVAVNLTGATVKFRMRLAGNSALKVDTTATIVNAAAGTVQYDWAAIDTDTPGEYVCWWVVTFPSARTQDGPETILVISDHAPGSIADLCTIADVGASFSLPGQDDQLVQMLITAASKAIMKRYSREFTPLANGATRTYRVDHGIVDLAPHDLRAATTVTLDPNGAPRVLTAGTDYKLLPVGGSDAIGTFLYVALSRQLTIASTTTTNFGFAELQILGDFGAFSTQTVPSDIRRAAVETVGSWIDRAAGQYSAQAFSGDHDFAARPDRFAGWGIPATAHRILSQYARSVV